MSTPAAVQPVVFSHSEREETIDYGKLAANVATTDEADSPDFRAPHAGSVQRRPRGRQR
ncbi:hypothetical protein SacmaDRAFT_4044 [Saccharomonospora marina XMU15]|uniref:Uncharacterized protein n=1 Tax=Saccharomonospora marina XMU15 TaxID=882083 RepID=H5X4W0_9PSEU|nr:hypothetical protein [Saccharomonospora marina]EHR52239.1 hypothetical protein SacmaDRAFT_4044 [Saccharomonospora marina XMU15]